MDSPGVLDQVESFHNGDGCQRIIEIGDWKKHTLVALFSLEDLTVLLAALPRNYTIKRLPLSATMTFIQCQKLAELTKSINEFA